MSANDGIVSTAGLVAGATAARGPILTAGVAGMVAGAVSMALPEYVSMSSQPDTERALLYKERADLASSPAAELDELAAMYVAKGARVATARRLAEESTAKDALAAHVDAEPASIQGDHRSGQCGAAVGRAGLRLVLGGGLVVAVTYAAGRLVGAAGLWQAARGCVIAAR